MEIHLNKLKFHAHHGVFFEETQMGGEFEVNVTISFYYQNSISNLEDTVDYVKVYNCIAAQMAKPHRLLESLAEEIANQICILDKKIDQVSISISKLNPPIKNFTGTVGITHIKKAQR